ncbi:hypothetical protein HAX54_015055 [Datura stramonium]|uniref:NB-ARC domain-containing protein n=1 Tax=Datura stramonium TaxID=4076 RepID=A0ABS8TNY5_DATST|nr:hypothetical protein [Datura stramonium]
MKKIFLGELKASKFTQSRIFKDKKLPKGFSHHLHSLLMYLRNKKLENFPNNVTAQNIHVAIEFLLIFLVDVSNHVISGKSLNEVLEERYPERWNCEHEILKDLQKRTISLAYEAEFAIDSTLVQYNSHSNIFRLGSNSVNDEEIVCFEIAAEKLLKYLTRGTSELDVIPIVGMGGQGKTTCARKLYNNDNIVCHFDVRAWCIVSQTYNRRKLLQEIFSQVTGSEDKGDKDDVLADMLRKSLMGKRYLIVLDDMWDAGIIEKKKMRESWWHEVKDALFDYLDCESEDYSRATMLLSYENLPDHLRPCLLYIGMFPEDHIISVSQLISLWIAEGFVQNIESGRLEETAEGYLNDLISSNVVMVSKRRYNSKVKYCQVHDIVLHFCLEKSREERFMWVMKGHYSNFRPSRWKESRVSFSLINEIPKFASVGSKTRKPLHQHLRSLVMTNEGGFYDWNPFRQVSEVRLLKVLDLSSHRVRALSSATLKPLIHLKYLAVSTNEFHFHPKSHLPHLETLIVKGLPNPTYLPTTVLPAIFWKMEKLRCVELPHAKFDLEGMFKESFKLENLRILRLVVLKIDSRDVLLQRCPNLQQLYISLSGPEICLKLESLDQLQILRLSFGRPQIVSELHLPSNLNKLILFGAPIESLISFIAGLPSLEYLQLDAPQFISSEEWCLGDIMFPKLKVLKLVMLGISRWDVSDASFPQLETLVMKRCWKLEEIPFSFADIQMLKQIKLIGCQNNSLEASAERIKEEVEQQGCSAEGATIAGLNANRFEEGNCCDD